MRSLWNDSEEARPEFLAARRFLFLQYETALGTAVHATPTYEALRRAVPDAVITVLCSGMPYEVLKYNPNIDSIIRTPHPLREWGKAVRFFLIKLWNTRKAYDCVITDSGNRRSCFTLLAFLTGVRRRIGFETSLNLNHASLSYDPDKSVLANNLSLIGALGHPCAHVEPTVFCSPRETEEIDSLIREQGIAEGMPLVALQTQTSGGEPNQWYDDRFIEFADSFYESTRAQIIFVGAKSERGRIESIRGAMRAPSFSAAGRTDIPGLAALLSRCDLLVTLDTGTMHVGRAVNVPMVIIAPAKNPEHEWLPPHSENIRVLIRQDIPCAQCRKTFCATRECMDAIHPNEVLEAALQHLREFPPSVAARQSRLARGLRRTSLL